MTLRMLLPIALLVAACAPEDPHLAPVEPVLSPLEQGEALYLQYCQNCHGTDARGTGPVADMLRIPPTDLTLIAERNMGPYPADEVASYIDGRRDTDAHGPRSMPVWGNIWTDTDGSPEAEAEVQRQINLIVEYLRTLQEDIPDL
ncbi:MAG: c-type cytochrome [Rhodothermales bacterium]|nr:c-type cytochrome [Rhodothermales bacterium]MBO6778519.1 c-type cytochrome [Rhodothermales bacterium]